MATPVYPAILTKFDWDKNKGTIGKTANELGIGRAVADAEAAFKAIDWTPFNQSYTAQALKGIPHANLSALVTQIQAQQQRLQDSCDALLKLANTTYQVVQSYERATTFAKPTIEHVRRMKQTATDFRTALFQKKLDEKTLLLARKAKGFAKLATIDFDIFCGTPALTTEFMKLCRKQMCDVEFEFMMAANAAHRATGCPSGPEADDMYNRFIKVDPISKSNPANVAATTCARLEAFYQRGLLRNPGAQREDVRKAWAQGYQDGKNMFLSIYKQWRKNIDINDSGNFLLTDVLQA
jgi:hypothetical protein